MPKVIRDQPTKQENLGFDKAFEHRVMGCSENCNSHEQGRMRATLTKTLISTKDLGRA